MLSLGISHSVPLRIRCIPIRASQLLYFSDDKKKSSEEKSSKEKSKEQPKHESKNRDEKESSTERLNKLLASMQTDDGLGQIKKVHVTTATSKKSRQEKVKLKKIDTEEKPSNIIEAAKNVADLMGENKQQTESELLSKLRGHIDGPSPTSEEKDASNETKDLNLRDVIVGMLIDRTRAGQQTPPNRGQYVKKNIEDNYQSKHQRQLPKFKRDNTLTAPHPSTGSVNLFGSEPIRIFKNKDELNPSPDILKTWEYLYERELNLSVTHPPANYFQKMILWTEQGKLWKFPIDNEQGLDEEAKVDFSEHVFMEHHLEGWCPDKGPIRHFMELVCVGLSKNPYITAQDKKEHIFWYRDYFEQKKDILKELIVHKEENKEKQKGQKAIENM